MDAKRTMVQYVVHASRDPIGEALHTTFSIRFNNVLESKTPDFREIAQRQPVEGIHT